jgi:hypothetical protein
VDDITFYLPPVDGARLHLAADSISLQDEPATILAGILPKGNCAILLDENLVAGGRRSGPRTAQFECARWASKNNATRYQRNESRKHWPREMFEHD